MIRNVHYRELPVPVSRVGPLLDGILEPDSIWPSAGWPALRLSDGLAVGSAGGHGPIRYQVSDYRPGSRVEFTFDPAIGLAGTHALELHAGPRPATTVVRHVLIGRPRGSALLAWPLAIRWLHDALIEDLLDNLATAAGHPPVRPARWSPWVRLARRAVGRRPVTPGRTLSAPPSRTASGDSTP